ncbi:DUF4113 domain-containing protein [Sphingomonas sp. WHRI 8995]
MQQGAVGAKRLWAMRRARLSPCYTTRLGDVVKAQA